MLTARLEKRVRDLVLKRGEEHRRRREEEQRLGEAAQGRRPALLLHGSDEQKHGRAVAARGLPRHRGDQGKSKAWPKLTLWTPGKGLREAMEAMENSPTDFRSLTLAVRFFRLRMRTLS